MRTPPGLGDLATAADTRAAAPGPNPHPVPLAAPVHWTALIYMVADNDLEPFGIEDLNEMEAAPDYAEVNVVVQVDRSSRYDTTNGDWSTTRRMEVRPDSDTATVGSLFLADLGEQNMGDPQTLADFLVWGVDTYPADHYLVVIWDHGYGWSGGIGNDLGNGDHLSVTELGSALSVGADHLGRPFDILAFDACLMQQVDVLVEVAWVADFFVGAQNLEPATGWPYEEMVAALGANAGNAPRAVAAALSSSYMGFYGTQGRSMMSAAGAAPLRTTLVSALNRLAGELGALVEDPSTMGQGSAERAIWEARDRSPAMFITDYIDLGDFARRLEGDARLPSSARAAATAVRSAVNATVFAEAHSVYQPGLTGITVYLPATSVPLRYSETRWAREGLWDEFVVAYLSGVPFSARPPTLTVTTPANASMVARYFQGSFSATQLASELLQLQHKVAWGEWAAYA
ncbi:MAG: clostripain-related cysteine peptidase, partial [Actinomycetota bacterium]